MAELWSLENQYAVWLKVELAVLKAQARLGLVPAEAADTLERLGRRLKINVGRIAEIEAQVHHDVIAFVTAITETAGDAGRYLHYGLTSSDVVDTALALKLAQAADMIEAGLANLLEALKEKALAYKGVPIMGRSHGIHAEPTTFGLKMALYYDEFKRHRARLRAARKVIAVGKLSGPVGNYTSPSLPPAVEEKALAELGLAPAPAANQVIQRDRHGEYFAVLALLASSVEKLATEIRHLARTEVREAEEPFAAGQKGSSAMPHKRNPILAENLCGLARLVRANALAAWEDIPLWHERDISHSSVERVIAPDSTSLIDFMLARLTGLLKGLKVYPENMLKNLALSGGLYNSQLIMLTLVERGLDRDEAYRLVQARALEVWERGGDFKKLLLSEKKIAGLIKAAEMDDIFSFKRFTAWEEHSFNRVFKAAPDYEPN